MDNKFYILEGREIKEIGNVLDWAKSYESKDRYIGSTEIDGSTISTVFLGLNHNHGEGKPLLFETMIFGGEHDGFQQRYSTYSEAEQGHKDACKMVADKFN